MISRTLGPRARRVNRHSVRVGAPPNLAYDAALGVSLRELPVVRLLFTLRRIPYARDMTLRQFFTTPPFHLVEEEAPREVVFAIEGYGIRAMGNFCVEGNSSESVISTETWVETFTPRAARLFQLYWVVTGPFSGLIRRMFLGAAKRRAEQTTG